MSYSIKNLRLFAALTFISALLLLGDHLQALASIRPLMEFPVVPAKAFFTHQRVVLDQKFSFLITWKKNQHQFAALQTRQQQTAVLVAQLAELREENAALRKLLGAPLPSEWKFLPARVVGRAPGIIYLDRGLANGARQGMVVVAQGILVGQIARASDRQAKVNLIVGSLKVPALVRSSFDQRRVAKGVIEFIGSQLLLTKVLPGEKLSPADLVVTSGEGDFLPGIPVGTIVKSFMDQPTDAFQQATLEPLINFSNLNRVEVVIDW